MTIIYVVHQLGIKKYTKYYVKDRVVFISLILLLNKSNFTI